MKYLITERQYNLLTEDKILRLDFDAFNNDWNLLQRFLEKKGNPPYILTGNLHLRNSNIKSLGNLVSVGGNLYLYKSDIESLGNLQSVGGDLDLMSCKGFNSLGNLVSVEGDLTFYKSDIESLGNLQSVGGSLYLKNTRLSKTTTYKEIRNKVKVGGGIYL